MYENQRQHNRIEVRWPCRVFKKGVGMAKGEITNASLGGAFLTTSLKVSLSDLMLLEIETISSSELRRILCQAKIVRTADVGVNEYGYGLLFSQLKDDDFSYLLQLFAVTQTGRLVDSK